MTRRAGIVAALSICTVFTTVLGTAADGVAHADDPATALANGINRVRQPCAPVGEDPRLTAAAQRHAYDMLRNGLGGHVGSDGSSPQARMADAGYARSGYTGEIVYWGTGSAGNPGAAVDGWMGSPPHRAIITNCAFTVGGFATASDGSKMTAVGDLAGQ